MTLPPWLLALLTERYPRPRNRIEITAHSIHRARIRWLEPNDAAAAQAIRRVLEQGQQHAAPGCIIYQHGTRCVRVVNHTAVTVTVTRMKRLEVIRSKARRDLKERRGR